MVKTGGAKASANISSDRVSGSAPSRCAIQPRNSPLPLGSFLVNTSAPLTSRTSTRSRKNSTRSWPLGVQSCQPG